jgi:hypothetical protein
MDKGQRVREILSHLLGLELAIKGLTDIEERERESRCPLIHEVCGAIRINFAVQNIFHIVLA